MPETPLTRDQLHEILRCQDSFRYWLGTYVRLQDPQLGVIPFALWPCHLQAIDALERHQLLVILKARQLGMSWLFGAAYPIWLCQFHPNKLAMLFSIRDDEASELIRKGRFVWSHQPEWMKVALAKDNRFELEFAGMDSRMLAFPSSPNAGSSYTANYVLSDEHAKQEYAEPQFAAIRPTIDSGGGQFVSLSTANGPGTLHAQLWAGAVSGVNGFHPLFFSYDARPGRTLDWWNSMRVSYTEDWRFMAEYPRDPSEAITTSQPRRFAEEYLQLLASSAKAITYDSIKDVTQIDEDHVHLLRIRGRSGELGCRIYQLPRAQGSYVIGADVAEGNVYGDASAAIVLDRATGEEVAILHGRWAIPDFAVHLDHLANLYGALLGIERNNQGTACILAVQRLRQQRMHDHKKLRYDLYHERPILDAKGKIARPGKPGWLTTERTKPMMLVDLEQAMRQADIRLATPMILQEMRTMLEDANGKIGAAKGHHDDLVMACAIAYQMVTKTQRPQDRPVLPYAVGPHARQRLVEATEQQDSASRTDPFGLERQARLIAQAQSKQRRMSRLPLLQRLSTTNSRPRPSAGVPAW